MKKLLLFGSFFLISFLTGLTGDSSHVQADGYGESPCSSTTDCPPLKVSKIGTYIITCCGMNHLIDTAHKHAPSQ